MTIARREFLRKAGASAAGVAARAACGGGGEGGGGAAAGDMPRVNWRATSSFPPSADILFGASDRIASLVSDLTGGQFTMRVYGPGEIVPALQVMDAVMQGTVQCGVSPGYYYMGKSPALAFDSAVPFGLTHRQQIAWLHYGGGLELVNKIYEGFGVVMFPATATGGQMGGWFRRPVESLADLNGLRFRIPGIGGEILSRLGVTVQVLAAAEIYPALERGAIDATEWVGPHDDEKMGLFQVAKNYYYPGWWEPGVSIGLLVNLQAYNELPPLYQKALQVACAETQANSIARYDAENPMALNRLVQDQGVTVRPFPQDIMQAALRESMSYLEEHAASDATFREVYESWKAFRDASQLYWSGNELSYQNMMFGGGATG